MRKYSLLFLLMLGVAFANAQDEDTEETQSERIGDAHVSNFRDWSIGISAGAMFTYGDLSTFNFDQDDNFHQFDLGLGLNVTKYWSSVWGTKLQATFAPTLSGSNGAVEPNTIITFEGDPYIDYNLNAVLNLSALALRGKTDDRNWTALVSAGIGMANIKQTRFVNGNPVAVYAQGVNPDADNEWTNEVFVPADLIIKWQLAQPIDLDLGVQMKYYFSDIIDAFPSGRSNDIVLYPHVGVAYNFGADDAESVVYTNPLDDMYMDVVDIKEDFDQLTTDDDKDGVPNMFDSDNSTPEGVAVDGSGNALDVDQDGIPDHMDEDPFTGKGAKVDAQGRAIDSDKDGVADYRDKEPNTPQGELVNFQGKSLKGAGVGGSAYMPSVYFPFNSANIPNANEERLATIALAMKNNSSMSIRLIGHADVRGTEQYNMELAKRRAQAVKDKLVQIFEIDESRITVDSQGEADPLAKPRENYSINRRVDVIAE